ncbi:macro domain-containing protein [uncultured Veillonella sp.]|uniref:macro domain-containing protein n=1 Tax=uncultured Veillonella sp. TaxID=159268 RepID=UPI0025DB96BA|nr:macro domain-containing protein [uncultured Veillonella sp.]
MNLILNWYYSRSYQLRDSIEISLFIFTIISTIFTILGVSLSVIEDFGILIKFGTLILCFLVLVGLSYFAIGKFYREKVCLNINQNLVDIRYGNLFEVDGWKVIGCDTHFDTRIDDSVISKKSLHGQLILNHGNIEDINVLVKEDAERLKLKCNKDGLYSFPLGTVIRYDSSYDHQTYLMLSMTELNSRNEAHTNMVEFINTLSTMWKEINRVYASHDIVIPVLGTGISRFDGNKSEEELLKAMLYTLYISRVKFNSRIKIVIYGNERKLSLYECKRSFSNLLR